MLKLPFLQGNGSARRERAARATPPDRRLPIRSRRIASMVKYRAMVQGLRLTILHKRRHDPRRRRAPAMVDRDSDQRSPGQATRAVVARAHEPRVSGVHSHHDDLDGIRPPRCCQLRSIRLHGLRPEQAVPGARLVPEPGDPEFGALLRDPHKFMLETLPSQEQATVLMMVVESLSTHSPDEEYLGYNGMHTNWSSDERAVHAFKAFSARLAAVDRQIHERNADLSLKHRSGAGTLPYSLLLQKSDAGITMRGIPNSISI